MEYTLHSYSIHYSDDVDCETDLEVINQYIRHNGISQITYILFALEHPELEYTIVVRLTRNGSIFRMTIDRGEVALEDVKPFIWHILGNCGNLDVRLRDLIRPA